MRDPNKLEEDELQKAWVETEPTNKRPKKDCDGCKNPDCKKKQEHQKPN